MNTWISIILVLCVLCLGYILLAYFGVFRKLTINLKDPEDYLSMYRGLEKPHNNSSTVRFVISLSTTPEDISKMKPVISSLLDQTVQVDEICINIPPKATGIIPVYLEKCIKVYKINKDYGICNNIIPTLNREKNSNTVILALENDVVYGKDFVQKVLEPLSNTSNSKDLIQSTYLDDGISSGSIVTYVGNVSPDIVNQSEDIKYSEKWISDHLKGDKVKINYNENYKAFISSRK